MSFASEIIIERRGQNKRREEMKTKSNFRQSVRLLLRNFFLALETLRLL